MKIKDLTLIAMFTALIAVCSWITIPAAVPFTLQTFAVFLALGLLGGRRGTISVLTYIILGAVGAPVFSNFNGGIGALLGNTGGYIIGFLAASLVVWGLTHLLGNTNAALVISMVTGLLVCYAFGTAWFMFAYMNTNGTVSLITVLSWCVIPFVIPDLIKIFLALLLAKRLKRLVSI
jgi:biotin transport system substrate-specific component